MVNDTKATDSAFPSDPVEQLRWYARNGVKTQDGDDRLLWAAAEIERLRAAIMDAINYCYKYEREHEVGATEPLLPIWQDLQAAVGL